MHIAIIGGGPGGYVAAIRARQLGAEVTLIEKERLGGTCLHRGCIPTKSMYQSAQVVRTLKRSGEFGVDHGGFTVDMSKIQSRKRDVVDHLCGGIEQLVRSHGIAHIKGYASFSSLKQLFVVPNNGESYLINAECVLIATGSVPAMPPIQGIDLPGVMSSNQLLEIPAIPKSMVVIGGGVIGMEFAGILEALGTKVTVVEYLPRILNEFDRDLVARLAQAMRKDGVIFATGMKVTGIERRNNGNLEVMAQGKRGEERFEAEKVLVATGRGIQIDGLGLDNIGIKHNKMGIHVDKNFETSVSGIYAIGDVIGKQMLAHVASEQGKTCAEHIMGMDTRLNDSAVPAVVFTHPQIASVGITEDGANERGMDVSVGRFMMGANAKAVTMGEEFGLIKVVAKTETKEIVGVHILGAEAGTIIHEAALAVANKLTIDDVEHTIHAHPTLSEAFQEAVLSVNGNAIHAAAKKRIELDKK